MQRLLGDRSQQSGDDNNATVSCYSSKLAATFSTIFSACLCYFILCIGRLCCRQGTHGRSADSCVAERTIPEVAKLGSRFVLSRPESKTASVMSLELQGRPRYVCLQPGAH